MESRSTYRLDSPSRVPARYTLRALWNQFRRRRWHVREVRMDDLHLTPAKCAWCGGPVYTYPRGENHLASARCQAVRCSWRWIEP